MSENNMDKKIAREQRVVAQMIAIYCRGQHKSRQGLCPQCARLALYAQERAAQCPQRRAGRPKTFCSSCPVHCYAPTMREQIRAVMRFAGPRMLFYHPLLALWHLWDSKINK